MHFTGPVYCPPFEARSFLLQVTTGCSHNRCAFCTMYRDVPFTVEPLSQIEADLQEAEPWKEGISRVFLESGDPFTLSYERLCRIAELIHRYLPHAQTIAMYASIRNISGKTDAELSALRKLGINELNIGVESGSDAVLRAMHKGYNAREARHELLRLSHLNFLAHCSKNEFCIPKTV
ncbi:MAG: radical SAM protein [Clostridia bacterium]|nr:radical SAM protein [Clostridia bacterium]MBR1686043.1 radical SAM protein [Clostridia bacterium]